MVSYSYWVSFAWGLAVTLSFIGWGAAAARFAGIADEDRDWPLCACWGMALLTAIGGVLALFRLANGPVLIGLGIAGWYLAAMWFRAKSWDWMAASISALTLLIWYAPSVASRDVEPYDDYLAYFTFARRFLETGTLIEPFSFRRLLSYGGQSLLHALTIAVGSQKAAHLLDSGIAMLILSGLVYGGLRAALRLSGTEKPRYEKLWAALGTLAVLLVPISRHNVASQATGLIIWIAAYRTLQLKSRPMVLTGLLLATLCAMRSNYVLGVGLLIAGLTIEALREKSTLMQLECIRLVASICAGAAAWAVLSYQSSGSLLYPLFAGFQTPGMTSSYQTLWTVKAHAVLQFVANPSVLFLLVPLATGAILVRGLHTAFFAAAILLVVVVPWSAPLTDDSILFRYVQPMAWGSLLIGAGALVQACQKTQVRKNVAVAVALLMMPVWAAYAAMTVKQSIEAVRTLPAQIADSAPPFPSEKMGQYRSLNAALPAGASVFAIVPLPSALDYRTHRIFNADLISFASLPPGLPFFHGPQELKQYLLSEGIEYVAFNDFDHPAVETGYWRAWWRDRAPVLKPDFAPTIPYVLDLMKNVDELAWTEGTTFRSGDLRVIHLSRGSASIETRARATPTSEAPQK